MRVPLRQVRHRQQSLALSWIPRTQFSSPASSSGDDNLSDQSPPPAANRSPSSYRAWRIRSYDGIGGLRQEEVFPVPILRGPDDVLVKVRASSVNPLDVAMTRGYGYRLFNALRDGERLLVDGRLPAWLNAPFAESKDSDEHCDEFPITLGRDFSGEVVAAGVNSSKKFNMGQEVWGAIYPTKNGCHADYVVASKDLITAKPKNLEHFESASVPYAGLTAYSALIWTGELSTQTKAREDSVLVVGASGGVGHLAVQMLRAWGKRVTAVCSKNAFEMLESLGADDILDYRDPDYERQLSLRKYDLILDCSGGNSPSLHKHLKAWTRAKYVTVTNPLLRNFDNQGLGFGFALSACDILSQNLEALKAGGGAQVRWAFFTPIPGALEELKRLTEEGKLRPVIQEKHSFSEVPEAFQAVTRGNVRGKVVVEV